MYFHMIFHILIIGKYFITDVASKKRALEQNNVNTFQHGRTFIYNVFMLTTFIRNKLFSLVFHNTHDHDMEFSTPFYLFPLLSLVSTCFINVSLMFIVGSPAATQLASKYLYTSQHNRHLRFRHQNFSALYIDKVLWRNKKVKQQKCGFKELYTNFALQLAVHYFSTQFNRLVFYIPWYGKENFANKNKKIHYTQYMCTQSAILFFADCKFDSRWYFIQVVDYVRYSQFYKHFC